MNNISAFRSIYKLYIFFLPFSVFFNLSLPAGFTQYVFPSMSTFFMVLGMGMMLLSRTKLPTDRGLMRWRSFYIFMCVYSFVAAIVLYAPLGMCNGEYTFNAILGDIVYYFLVLISIYYNYYGLKYLIRFEDLHKIFRIQIVLLLCMGYIQFLVINGVGAAVMLYTFLSNISRIVPAEFLERGITFFGSEPASASLLGIQIFPYMLAMIICMKNKKQRFRYIFLFSLFIPLVFNSNSSSFVLTFLFNVIAAALLMFRRLIIYKITLVGAFAVGLMYATLYGVGFEMTPSYAENSESLEYVLYGKLIDTENESTVMRTSSISNDMKIFFKYPITGVGNGMQGFFFNEHLPTWARGSEEIQTVLSGSVGVVGGGGAFFPSYLSAFGLIGLIALWHISRIYQKYVNAVRWTDYTWYMVLIFLMNFLMSAWVVVGLKQNESCVFMLVIPLVVLNRNAQTRDRRIPDVDLM